MVDVKANIGVSYGGSVVATVNHDKSILVYRDTVDGSAFKNLIERDSVFCAEVKAALARAVPNALGIILLQEWFEPAEPVTTDHDPVNHPKHYTSHPSGVECIQIIREMSFNLGNVVKYIWRDGLKDEVPLQDLKKAAWYLNDEIERREKSNDSAQK